MFFRLNFPCDLNFVKQRLKALSNEIFLSMTRKLISVVVKSQFRNVPVSITCFDNLPVCKDIIFLLSSTEMLTYVDMSSATIHIPTFIQKLSTPSLKYHEFDAHAKKLCVATHTTVCNMCNCELTHNLSICVRCFGVCHKECASGATSDCYICFRPQHFVHVTICNKVFMISQN